MSLFSFLRKNKQESAGDDGSYYSRAEEDSQSTRTRKRKTTAGDRRNEALDPVLPEKKRARRRLIGAVALVLAVVIGLPMILDSEPKPLADDIAIHIPSRDSVPPIAPARVAAVEDDKLASLDAREEVINPALAPAPAGATAAAAGPTPIPAQAPATATAPALSSSAGGASPADAPPGASAAVAPRANLNGAPATSVTPPPVRSDDGARALALLEGRAEPRAAEKVDKKAEKFVIQVAALASQEKVNELQGKLKTAGIQSYTQKVATEGGERTRVRVGPFASRDEAEKVRARIVKLGLNGTLVPA